MQDRTPDQGREGKGTGTDEDAADEREAKPGRTKFTQEDAIPGVQTEAGESAGESASDLAFGDNPRVEFRGAVRKRSPGAIAIAGKSPAAIGALLTKDPALAAEYFAIVEANRSETHRDALKALFSHLTHADKKKLFAAQYGFAIVENQQRFGRVDGGEFEPDQVDKMYEAAALLPPGHMTGNPKFKKLEAGNSATYYDQQNLIEMPSEPENSAGEMAEKYTSAFRHEVGHAVDFALGDKTNKLREEFGWHVINERNDDEKLATHLEELGVLATGLDAKDRLDLAVAMGASISGGESYMKTHLNLFRGVPEDKIPGLIARGVTPLWKARREALYDDGGVTIGDQHYFARGFGIGGWAYRVKKSTFDAAPPKAKISHYEWFAEWYATYYATPDHSGVSGRLREFFRDEVDPFNQQRSPLGSANTAEGTGGETPRHM